MLHVPVCRHDTPGASQALRPAQSGSPVVDNQGTSSTAPALSGSYSTSLVVLSFLIAVQASYTALNMAGRLALANRNDVRWWLLGGTFALGPGAWLLHFVGMLAFSLPVAIGYDLPLTALSLAASLAASGYALWLSARPALPWLPLTGGGLAMGSGIAAMHCLGMAAMAMQPASCMTQAGWRHRWPSRWPPQPPHCGWPTACAMHRAGSAACVHWPPC